MRKILKPYSFLFLTPLMLLASACISTQISTPSTPSPTPAANITPTELPARATHTATSPPPPTPTPQGIWMQLLPDSGPPGTVVRVDGFLPGVSLQSENLPGEGSVNVCWESCLGGFHIDGLRLDWSPDEVGRFTLSFMIPSQPWMGAEGPVLLMPGSYSVGLQCLDPSIQMGCALEEAVITASFQLLDPASERCHENQPCATMDLSPDLGPPGSQIQVRGWAPLVKILGDQPFGYSLVLQVPGSEDSIPLGGVEQSPDGHYEGSFTIPQMWPSFGTLAPGTYKIGLQAVLQGPDQGVAPTIAVDAGLQIEEARSWLAQGYGKPLWIQTATNLIDPTVTVDPLDSQRLAYCSPGEIRESRDGGVTWKTVSTRPVAAAADALGYPLFAGEDPGKAACVSVALDPGHPRSYFAIFETAHPEFGAPPLFFTGFYTLDDGNTWAAIPTPADISVETFGGFRNDSAGDVLALFGDPDDYSSGGEPEVVLKTSDGGASWSPGTLPCPVNGPCLRWGTPPGSIAGMGTSLPQAVLVSIDGGAEWTISGLTVELRMPGPNQLVAYSDKDAIMLSGSGGYPVRLTRDGGLTWEVLALPPNLADEDSGSGYPGLQALPDGRLLAMKPDSDGWLLLEPGAGQWCALGSQSLAEYPVHFQVSVDQLWWIDPVSMTVFRHPLASLHCQLSSP